MLCNLPCWQVYVLILLAVCGSWKWQQKGDQRWQRNQGEGRSKPSHQSSEFSKSIWACQIQTAILLLPAVSNGNNLSSSLLPFKCGFSINYIMCFQKDPISSFWAFIFCHAPLLCFPPAPSFFSSVSSVLKSTLIFSLCIFAWNNMCMSEYVHFMFVLSCNNIHLFTQAPVNRVLPSNTFPVDTHNFKCIFFLS